jgi:hypothetical protein
MNDEAKPPGGGEDERQQLEVDQDAVMEPEPEEGPLARQRAFLEERLAHLGPVGEVVSVAEAPERARVLEAPTAGGPPPEGEHSEWAAAQGGPPSRRPRTWC